MAKRITNRGWARGLFLTCLFAANGRGEPHLGGTLGSRDPAMSASTAGRLRLLEPAHPRMRLLDAAIAADPLLSPANRSPRQFAAATRIQAVARAATFATSNPQRAEAAFKALHRDVLVGSFDPHCASVDRTLRLGTYNCLTGTILYLAVCETLDLPATAIASPGHVAVRIWFGHQAFDVETTDPAWSPRLVTATANRPSTIGNDALLARVYYNFGIELAQQSRYELAVQMNQASYRLDPTLAAARSNLLATLNNWSIELIRAGQLAHAETIIREGLRVDASYGPLHRSQEYLRSRRHSSNSL